MGARCSPAWPRLSILIGNLVALAQTNVRRLLAYSAVAHAGYTLLGLVAGGRDGFSATLFYTTIYAFTLVGAFGVVALVRRDTGGDDLANFAGLRRARRFSPAAWRSSCFLWPACRRSPDSLANSISSAPRFAPVPTGLLWLVVLALFGSLISLYYYLIVLKAIFVDQSDVTARPLETDWLQRAAVTVLATAVVLLGVLPSLFLDRIAAALP